MKRCRLFSVITNSRSYSTAQPQLIKPQQTNTQQSITSSDLKKLLKTRNIGISAHIDSGKTTLTERVLYYTGRINDIHEVRGKDNVGAKMDSMELEKEKGITIQSAATFTTWKNHSINIIDTPGHVDFTIEVERALRVLDGAVLVLCAVGGVQSQTITVDRQMKRYHVPRVCFINKMDRAGSNPFRIITDIRKKLRLNAAAVQIPIGAESDFEGVVDIIRNVAYYHEGVKGNIVKTAEIPPELLPKVQSARADLIANLAEVDDEIADLFLEELEPTQEQLITSIRNSTISRKFVPVFMGSAYHNKGVQPLLDGILDYLPAPHQVSNQALNINDDERKVELVSSSSMNFVGLAFKLEEGRYGQLTYMRVYQGTLKKGGWIVNVRTGKKIKVPRLVRMHSNEMEDVDEIGSGDICALFGVECASGDTFTDGTVNYSMTTMFVPSPVISLSITPQGRETPNFGKALSRFQREDPTFKVHIDKESKQTIISGMGELHLEIYLERMKREYGVNTITGKPQVAFRETITKKVEFNYTHKKQSGGSGQFAKVIGYIEPIEAEVLEEDGEVDEDEEVEEEKKELDYNEFENATVGMNVPSNYIPAVQKGFLEACSKGFLSGNPITNSRLVLEDGMSHAVDSSELAFKLATQYAFREAFLKAAPIILEPIMTVSASAPSEYQGVIVGLLNKRKGTIVDSEVREDYVEITSEVPLNEMFGFSTDIRSITQGKGEFSMEYARHSPVLPNVQAGLVDAFNKARLATAAKK